MSKNSEHHDTYIIPPNFIEGSTLFGGMFKIRNVIEAGVLAAAVGVPVFSLDLSLTVRIIILCLTALPLALFALMGIAGEPLSSYIIAFFKWLKNRRVVGKTEPKEERKKPKPKKEKQPAPENESMLSEIAGVIRKQSAKKKHTEEPRAAETPKQKKPHRRSKADSPFLNPVAEYLPIEKIANGIIYTKDHRYIKLIEVVPINFLLRSAREQRSIIYSFISYLKISPVKIQFKVLTKRADLNKHTEIVHREMEAETDPNCRVLQEDYLKLINQIGSREATTRRFFVAFEYEQVGRRSSNEEADAIASLQTAARTAANYLKQCGNEVLTPENEDEFTVDVLYTMTADNAEDLEWRECEMRKLLISQDLNIVSCSFREEQGFLSSLPLTNLEKHLYERSKRNVLTSGAASCYPFTAYELSDDNGILLGVNKYNNSLVIVDIFNSAAYKNANIAIMGTSGAGKTFTLQLMALRMRRKGTQVFIIAPLKGHEFLRACRNTGGEFIQISPASKNCINVMEIRKTDRSVDELLDGAPIEKSELAAKIQQLHIFFSLLIPDITHEERQLLDEALIKTYNAKGITHDNDTLKDPDNPDRYREMPILGDLYDILLIAPETKRLANILNRLVHGSASTFNQRTNVNLDNKYTVLDISELSGDLLTAGMFVALDYVWDKAKQNRTVEKTIFIDECWALIGGSANRLAANFVLEIAKIIRGYGGSAVFATQDLNDFFALDDGKYGKGIINNCKTKIVLNLEDEEAQRVQSILHLSEAEVMEITHFERGNGLISTNNNNITVEFRCSDLEKSLITTDRRELQELVEQKKR